MLKAKLKPKNYLKIIGLILLTVIALILIESLWWLYIIGLIVFFLVKKSKKNQLKEVDNDGIGKPGIWDGKHANPLLVTLMILCPVIGLFIVNNKRKNWFHHTGSTIAMVTWTSIWLLGFSLLIYQAPSYVHPHYKSTLDGIKIDTTINKRPTGIPQLKDVVISKDPVAKEEPSKQKPSSQQPKELNQASKPASKDTDVMSGVTIASAESVPYNRKLYQPNWSAGGGCDIRSRILTITSLVTVKYGSKGCTVEYGSWNDPYTGKVLTGDPYQGDGTANDLDIDHIIPLNYVNSHGGYHWSDSQKRAYGDSLTAMDIGVYLAVSASENRKKGDSGPSEYYPPNPDYKCEYSKDWRDTAKSYSISLSSADYNLIYNILISCGVN